MNRQEALKKDKSFYAEEDNGNWYVFGDSTGFAYHEAKNKQEAEKAAEDMNWRHAKNKDRWGSSKMAHKTKPASELKSGDGWVEADGNVLTVDKIEDKGSDVVVHFKQEHMNHIKPSTVKKTKKVVVAAKMWTLDMVKNGQHADIREKSEADLNKRIEFLEKHGWKKKGEPHTFDADKEKPNFDAWEKMQKANINKRLVASELVKVAKLLAQTE